MVQHPGGGLGRHDQERLTIGDWTTTSQGSLCSGSVAEAITTCLQSELAESTLTTYQAALWREVPASEQSAGYRLLPMDAEHKFLQMYGGMLARYGQELHWSKVRAVRAAILKWHERNGFSDIMVEWTPKMRGFWAGFKKQCKHTGDGKEPVQFEDLYRRHRILVSRLHRWRLETSQCCAQGSLG